MLSLCTSRCKLSAERPCAPAGHSLVGLVWLLLQPEQRAFVQAEEVKRAADQVAQLRRVGKGLGVFEFDRSLAATEAD